MVGEEELHQLFCHEEGAQWEIIIKHWSGSIFKTPESHLAAEAPHLVRVFFYYYFMVITFNHSSASSSSSSFPDCQIILQEFIILCVLQRNGRLYRYLYSNRLDFDMSYVFKELLRNLTVYRVAHKYFKFSYLVNYSNFNSWNLSNRTGISIFPNEPVPSKCHNKEYRSNGGNAPKLFSKMNNWKPQ